MSITGGCLCGNIRYEIDASQESALESALVCHCKSCQRQGGSAFSTLGTVSTADFSISGSEPKLYLDRETETGNPVKRYFCGDCGSPMYSVVDAQPGKIFLKTGTLDDTSGFVPLLHIWCASKQNWLALEEGIPQLEKQG